MLAALLGTLLWIMFVATFARAPVMWLSAAIIAACAVLFASLTVTVDDELIEARFGPGWIRKRIPLSEVVGCRTVRNEWWYGWGVRFIGTGWMYNISGLDAVELSLSRGGVFRIGTDEPEALCAAIEKRLAERAARDAEARAELDPE
jgi:hypothetical protein